MTLIEGVGDEVTQLFIALIILAVGVVAWCSTSISDQQPVRLLFLSEPQSQYQITVQSNSTTTPSSSSNPQEAADVSDTGQIEHQVVAEEEITLRATVTSVSEGPVTTTGEPQNNYCDCPQTASSTTERVNALENADVHTATSLENAESQNEPGKPVPTEVSILRQRRLAFLKKQGNSLLDSATNEEEAAAAANDTDQKEENENLMPEGICIRLKYLNDNQKLVRGSLREPLGDFKRRHFAVELEGNKIVRLVFNGQILQSDSETLQGYGLFDNCVVHCLVHSRHTSSSGAETSSNTNATRDQANVGTNAAYREWDLSHILYLTLFLVLVVAWYFHYHLAHLFNVASTLALIGLSTAFAISAAATYFPDTEEIRLI